MKDTYRFGFGPPKLWVIWFCMVLFILPLGVFAQTSGKIAGRVTEEGTGEPLPGANVVVVGTKWGTTADVNGDYFILQVSPGTYDVKASLVGYQGVSKTGVMVLVDRTTTIDFKLKESTLGLDEIVVRADLDPVQMDVSFAQQAITQAELESMVK